MQWPNLLGVEEGAPSGIFFVYFLVGSVCSKVLYVVAPKNTVLEGGRIPRFYLATSLRSPNP